MKRLAIVLLCLTASAMAADVKFSYEGPDGFTNFYDDAGPCVDGAKRAEFISRNGTKVPGCYRIQGKHFHVAYFDGDSFSAPISALRSPI